MPASIRFASAWPRALLVASAVGTLVVGLVALGAPSQAVPARPAGTSIHTCPVADQDFDCPSGDVDGDGVTDVTVGVPTQAVTATAGSGLVDVHLTLAGVQRIDEQSVSPGFTASSTDAFGASSAAGDIDGDGYGDLVIGAPGASGTGVVFVALGSSTGIVSTGTQILRGIAPGERFGATIALNGANLWIGAPNRTVDGQAGAGAVDWYVLGSDHQFHLRQSMTQDSADIGGTAEVGDGFGSALAAAGDGVLIGIPDEDIGTIKDAGLVTFIELTKKGYTSFSSDQDSPGVPGASEAGDHFGAAVATDGHWSLVGVPDEDIGSVKDAGMAQLYTATWGNPLTPSAGISQSSPGVPGVSETGDHFGTSLALTYRTTCFDTDFAVAIGDPGEDVGSIRDAGVVYTHGLTLDHAGFGTLCPWRSIYRGPGHGLGGTLEAGDQVGATLSTRLHDHVYDDEGDDPLLIGAPGHSVDGQAGAGAVIETEQDDDSLEITTYANDITQLGGATAAGHYGGSQTAPLSYG